MSDWEYAVPSTLLELPEPVESADDLVDVLRAGLPARSVRVLAEAMNLHRPLLFELLDLSDRTLRRRRLKRHESDRVYRVARVYARALDVLESEEAARAWLVTDNRALGWVTPLSLLDTDAGAREVEDVLGRIEYGVFS